MMVQMGLQTNTTHHMCREAQLTTGPAAGEMKAVALRAPLASQSDGPKYEHPGYAHGVNHVMFNLIIMCCFMWYFQILDNQCFCFWFVLHPCLWRGGAIRPLVTPTAASPALAAEAAVLHVIFVGVRLPLPLFQSTFPVDLTFLPPPFCPPPFLPSPFGWPFLPAPLESSFSP